METNSTHKEIFLVKDSRYLCREWAEKKEDSQPQSENEKLIEACWNGLIKELLPEIFDEPDAETIYLWQIREGNSFLELEMGDKPADIEHYFSIDPQLFLGEQELN